MRRPCIEPGCPFIARAGSARCDGCELDRGAAKNRRRRTTGTAASTKARRAVNKAGGTICSGCHQWFPAHLIQIDHIVELADGGIDTPANLQPLCQPHCHPAKTTEARRQRMANDT